MLSTVVIAIFLISAVYCEEGAILVVRGQKNSARLSIVDFRKMHKQRIAIKKFRNHIEIDFQYVEKEETLTLGSLNAVTDIFGVSYDVPSSKLCRLELWRFLNL
jgi:CHAD domain-containing protein